MRKFLKYILLFINAIAIGGLLVSYVSLYYPPDKGWIISLAGMAYPWILLGNVLLMMFWLFTKPKFIFLSLVTILLGFNVASRYFQLSGKTTEEQGIKVVSYNVKHFTGTGRNPSKDLADLIKGFLKETEPDIICLQEVKLRSNHIFNLQAAKSEFPSIRHYQYARASGTGGSVTLTRFPIVKMQEIRFENSGNIAICTDVVANNDTIRIFNIHLQSYRIDPDKYRIIGRQRISDEKDLEEVKELGMKYRDAVKMRAKQARVIHERISSSPYPVIVCGDFNDPPSSYSYQKVRGDLVDSFVGSGRGIGRTYVGKLPSFRIDYILHSDTYESYNFMVYDVPYSDHLPIACELIRN